MIKIYAMDPKGKIRRRPNVFQLQYESDGWKRLLTFILDENVYIKNRISEILRNNFDQSLLEDVESFQISIIKLDEMIRLLRKEIAEFDKLLIREIFESSAIISEIGKNVKSIRNNINDIESFHAKIKSGFNSYLFENIEA